MPTYNWKDASGRAQYSGQFDSATLVITGNANGMVLCRLKTAEELAADRRAQERAEANRAGVNSKEYKEWKAKRLAEAESASQRVVDEQLRPGFDAARQSARSAADTAMSQAHAAADSTHGAVDSLNRALSNTNSRNILADRVADVAQAAVVVGGTVATGGTGFAIGTLGSLSVAGARAPTGPPTAAMLGDLAVNAAAPLTRVTNAIDTVSDAWEAGGELLKLPGGLPTNLFSASLDDLANLDKVIDATPNSALGELFGAHTKEELHAAVQQARDAKLKENAAYDEAGDASWRATTRGLSIANKEGNAQREVKAFLLGTGPRPAGLSEAAAKQAQEAFAATVGKSPIGRGGF